jgi:Skp family chaperone for outer membrane proteins
MKLAWMTASAAIILLVGALAFARQATPWEPARVAFVSSQRILNELPDARAEVTRLRAAQKQRATDLRAKQQALEATRLKLSQAKDEATRQSLQQQQQQQETELRRAVSQAQADQQAEQRQLLADLQVRIRPTMEEVAKERNLDLFLNADTALMWGSARVDLTNEIVKRLKAKTAPPATGSGKP